MYFVKTEQTQKGNGAMKRNMCTLQPTEKKQRNSSFELLRIICMLLIVAHHYVVHTEGLLGGG